MLSIPSLVYVTTRENSMGLELPGPLNSVYRVVHWVHIHWRFYRYKEIYLNPENDLSLFFGGSLNLLFGRNGLLGESRLLRVVAQTVLIADCLFECIKQQRILFQSYQEWKDAIVGRYVYAPGVEWAKQKELRVVSSSTWNDCRLKSTQFSQRIKRIGLCTYRLFQNMLLLSMKMLDAIEACSLDSSTQNESICHFFVNGKRHLVRILECREGLLAALKSNKGLIERLLKNTKSDYTIEQMQAMANKFESAGQFIANADRTMRWVVGKVI